MGITALYVRVSTQEQATEGFSVDAQTDSVHAMARAREWEPTQLYIDPGYSGATLDRPALQRMISDINAGLVERVIVYKMDRLSRSQLDTLYLLQKVFQPRSVDFVSVKESLDTGTAAGKLMIGMLSAFAEFERSTITERMQMGVQKRVQGGQWRGGTPPIGYKWDEHGLYPDPVITEQVRRIYAETLQGYSPYEIRDHLNADGMLHDGREWSDVIVRRVLKNRTYMGYVPLHGEWYKSDYEPMVDEETWHAANRIVQQRSKTYNAHRLNLGHTTSLLTGLLYCKHCGERYCKYSRTRNRKKRGVFRDSTYECYARQNPARFGDGEKCHNKIWHMEELDDVIIGEVKKVRLADFKAPKEPKARGTSFQVQIDATQRKIDNLLDLYAQMPRDDIQAKIHELDRQRQALVRAQLQAESVQDRDRAKKDEIKQTLKSVRSVLEGGTLAQKRQLLRALIDRIELDGDNIDIYWHLI